jgi:hypothetical protein
MHHLILGCKGHSERLQVRLYEIKVNNKYSKNNRLNGWKKSRWIQNIGGTAKI